MNRSVGIFLAVLIGATTGFLIVTSSVLLENGWHESVLVVAGTSIEQLSLATVILLFVSGFVWGMIVRRPYSIYGASMGLLCFPLLAILEVLKDPTSHNLLPFEFLVYAVLTGVSLCGLKLAEYWKTWFAGA